MTDFFSTRRPRLVALAYRMLGSSAEAEDVVQDAHERFLAAEGLVAPHAWLDRVVTNLCLDRMKSARARREAYVGPWLPEPIVTHGATWSGAPVDPESISLAFLTLLERLTPLERAVYVLAEAFDYTAEEIAVAVAREPAAVRQALHRAREHVRAGKPRFAPSRDAHEAIVGTFVGAVMTGDVAAVERLLARDVVVRSDGGGKTRAALKEVRGANAVARMILGIARRADPSARVERREMNGWPAIVTLLGDAVVGVTELETDGATIFTISLVANPDKLAHVTNAPRASSSGS